jgi:hypothetical protein
MRKTGDHQRTDDLRRVLGRRLVAERQASTRRHQPARLNAKWRGGLGVAVAALAIGLSAAPAGAVVVRATSSHGPISYMRTPQAAAAFACTTTCGALTYHGGPVQHGEQLISIYWGPTGHYIGATYKAGINQWLNDFAAGNYGASNVFSVAQQYYDTSGSGGAKRFVGYNLINGGYINDADVYPPSGCTFSGLSVCLTDAQLRTEIQHIVSTRGLPTGPNVQYLLFLPYQVGQCFDTASTQCFAYGNTSNSIYCGYHSYIGSGSTQIVFAAMPFLYKAAGCDANAAFKLGYANGSSIDTEVGILSHEIIETMTDVNLNAWLGAGGNADEIGDKCAYNYNGTTYGSSSGLLNNGMGFYNQVGAGDDYLMQTEFSNRNSNGSTTGCVNRDTDTQPTVTSVSPSSATPGTPTLYTATVSDPAGLAYVTWNFGDGTASVLTTGSSLSHTYATAGTKTQTLIVTDAHGNEKKVVHTVTVS